MTKNLQVPVIKTLTVNLELEIEIYNNVSKIIKNKVSNWQELTGESPDS